MPEAEKNMRGPTKLASMIEANGSKMAHLILYASNLLESPDTRIIIFSQWSRLLHRISKLFHSTSFIGNNNIADDVLEENDIRAKFCRGNIHHRTNVCILSALFYNLMDAFL